MTDSGQHTTASTAGQMCQVKHLSGLSGWEMPDEGGNAGLASPGGEGWLGFLGSWHSLQGGRYVNIPATYSSPHFKMSTIMCHFHQKGRNVLALLGRPRQSTRDAKSIHQWQNMLRQLCGEDGHFAPGQQWGRELAKGTPSPGTTGNTCQTPTTITPGPDSQWKETAAPTFSDCVFPYMPDIHISTQFKGSIKSLAGGGHWRRAAFTVKVAVMQHARAARTVLIAWQSSRIPNY